VGIGRRKWARAPAQGCLRTRVPHTARLGSQGRSSTRLPCASTLLCVSESPRAGECSEYAGRQVRAPPQGPHARRRRERARAPADDVRAPSITPAAMQSQPSVCWRACACLRVHRRTLRVASCNARVAAAGWLRRRRDFGAALPRRLRKFVQCQVFRADHNRLESLPPELGDMVPPPLLLPPFLPPPRPLSPDLRRDWGPPRLKSACRSGLPAPASAPGLCAVAGAADGPASQRQQAARAAARDRQPHAPRGAPGPMCRRRCAPAHICRSRCVPGKRRADCRHRCGQGAPSPGADVG
jgi:hypothetical protein